MSELWDLPGNTDMHGSNDGSAETEQAQERIVLPTSMRAEHVLELIVGSSILDEETGVVSLSREAAEAEGQSKLYTVLVGILRQKGRTRGRPLIKFEDVTTYPFLLPDGTAVPAKKPVPRDDGWRPDL